ncbi:Integrator complex subunit 6 [Schistosoma japonicum]|uniref:Integrator complex subunit 6 n=1 Tax=Schistosoma japonicum TaxID=6182 RepID=A0A4Z2DX42_SCHJA|nr:Integrator complex subunit 6 [Schistosoma japonicum]
MHSVWVHAIGCVCSYDLEQFTMTIIVFLLDNSATMNQRTFQGTTLLDVAKSAIEIFFKIKMSKSRVDRYFVLTLNSDINYVKLTGWKQNVDLQLLHSALNNISPDGQIDLLTGVQRTFRMLNINRLQLGLENYGMGIYPSCTEPSVIICITGSIGAYSFDDQLFNNASVTSIESAVLGTTLTKESFRWDYRLYSLVLRFPAFINNVHAGNITRSETNSPLKRLAEETGGENFDVYDGRELHQCLDSLAAKCQSGVILKLKRFSESANDDYQNKFVKQLMLVKLMGRLSSWPIPEQFWPDEEMLASQLPPRSAHPEVLVSKIPVAEPELPEYFPVDRYELTPSRFTKEFLNSSEQNMVWRCFSYGIKKSQNAPFGYLKASYDLQSVHLHVLPYNYPVFIQLLSEICDHKRMTEAWGHQFVNYLGTIPKYYFMPLAKAFERIGFAGMIKPEAIDRALPYQLKHTLQKLRHTAKIEYDNFVRMTQSDSQANLTVSLPSSLLPLPLWQLREFKSMHIKPKRQPLNSFLRPSNISRCKLRIVLGKMKHDLDNLLSGKLNIRTADSVHQQPIALMGDYVNYRSSQDIETPLREINPTPERSDTFGNPFRRKSTSFIADEGFVDEMDSLQVNSCNPNMVLLNSGRKKSSQVSKSPQARVKGPLPSYINHLNWRFFSPKSSPVSSPRSSDSISIEEKANSIPSAYSDDSPSSLNQTKPNNQLVIEKTDISGTGNATSLESFKLNKEILFELIHLVRQPYAVDAVLLFDRMNELTGSVGQREAVVSMLMSEALRFKRSSLYLLLSDWRTWLLQSGRVKGRTTLRKSSQVAAKVNHIQLNGWS